MGSNNSILLLVLSIILFSLEIQAEDNKYTFKQGVTIAHWVDGLFKGRTYGDPLWFSEKDVTWIAGQGLDHIQIRVSGTEISDSNASLNKERLAVIDSAISWSKKKKLGVVLTLMSFPKFVIDSSLSEEKKEQVELQKQVAFWKALANYFSEKGSNVRFIINGRINRLTDDVNYLNKYNKQVLAAIRSTSVTRTVYLLSFDFDSLVNLELPINDNNIGVVTNDDYGAVSLFRDRISIYKNSQNNQLIKFPSTLPNFNATLEKDHRAREYSNVTLDKHYIDAYFKKASSWLKVQKSTVEFYLPIWGYYTGWPFEPKSIEDKESIVNYSRAFTKVSRKHGFGFAIYDYNSGMPIRYTNNKGSPTNNKGEASILLQAMDLTNKN